MGKASSFTRRRPGRIFCENTARYATYVDVNTLLMSMVLDEENITLDSNQNIEITANEVLNVGRSEFTYTDSKGAVQTKIEETQSITIDTEEICTVGVTSCGTVIELDEDNFMMPLNRVKMEGSVKDGFADMGSPGQESGEEAQQTAVVDVPELEVIEEETPKKNKVKKFLGCLGAIVTLAVGVVAAVVTCAVIGAAAPLIAFGLAIAFIAAGTVGAAAQFQEAMSDTN